MRKNCVLESLVIFNLITINLSKVKQCPKLKLECLKRVLNVDPSECESDSAITLQFAEGLGDNYDVNGLIPVDAYFLWTKVREIFKADPNSEIIPEELRGISRYIISNQQYGGLLADFQDLKTWKVSEDCTVWYPVSSKREQAKRSAAVWLKLARQLGHASWNDKLILFGRDRPSPVTEIFSDTVTPTRFVVQNLIAEHNWIATLGWIQKLSTISEEARAQALELQEKSAELELKVVKQREELNVANQQKVSLVDRINLLEEKIAEESSKQNQSEVSNIERELILVQQKQTELEQRIRSVESEGLVAGEVKTQTEGPSEGDNQEFREEEEFLSGNPHPETQDQIIEDGSGQSGIKESEETGTDGIKKLRKRNVSSKVKRPVKKVTKLGESVRDIAKIIKYANEIFDQVTQITKSLKSNTQGIKENKDDIKDNHNWQGSEIAEDWRSSNSSFLKKLARIIPEDTVNICLTISVFSIFVSVTAALILAGVVCKLQRSREFKVESRVQLLPERTLRRRKDHTWRITETRDRIKTSRAGRSTIELHPRTERVKFTRVRKTSL